MLHNQSDPASTTGQGAEAFAAPFAQRFMETAATRSTFCLGLDPSPKLLQQWNLSVDAAGLQDFCSRVLEAAADSVAIIKPQVAFFEALGPAGMTILQRLAAEAKQQGILVLADAKRSDIGSTMQAYAKAWIGPKTCFGCDAVTCVPWFGLSALNPLFEQAISTKSGVFVVVRSSNPEAKEIQNAMAGGIRLDDLLSEEIRVVNQTASSETTDNNIDASYLGPVGAVIGATLGSDCQSTIDKLSSSLILMPGIGAQGATFDQIRTWLSPSSAGRIIPIASRSVLAQGPDINTLRQAIKTHCDGARQLSDSPNGSPRFNTKTIRKQEQDRRFDHQPYPALTPTPVTTPTL